MEHRILKIALFICLLLFPISAVASPLGVAGEYNEFIFGNIRQWNTDAEGRVAAGGNLRYRNMSVASLIAIDPFYDLVVGGNLNWKNGSVGFFTKENSGDLTGDNKKGDIIVGGKAKIGKDGGGFDTVTYRSLDLVKEGAVLPFDFGAEQMYLQDMSLFWGQLAPTGITAVSPGEIFLTGTNTNLNIFSLSAADITKNIAFHINVPEGSTTLVNISGQDAQMKKIGFYYNGNDGNEDGDDVDGDGTPDFFFPDSLILYNFFEATSLKIAGIEVHGSILAPWAKTRFFNGHIEGNLIAKSLFGTGEAHNELFNGWLPKTPVPEPATLLLLGGGLAAIAAFRRRLNS